MLVGSTTRTRVRLAGEELLAMLSNDGPSWVPTPGMDVGVEIPSDSVRVLGR